MLALAQIYDRGPSEFADESRWPIEDRAGVLMTWRASEEAAKFKVRSGD